jgi:RNA polymerase sigma-70 factor (ECF subfamily)
MSDKKEFLEIISRYQGIIHKVCWIYFRNKCDREDAFQEILYQLWKSFPGIKNYQSVGSWIYAVSINISLARLRKTSRVEYMDRVPDIADKSDIIDKITWDESLKKLLNAIYLLDEIDRSIMLLYLEEKSYEEIAEIIGITKSNVGVRISRAKNDLKQNLDGLNYGK